jgi:hypothetical protein
MPSGRESTDMGSVVKFNRARPLRRNARTTVDRAAREAESNRSLIGLIVAFSFAALAMTAAVVITASDSWADALPLLACIFVIALAKVFLADALFYVMIRSDREADSRAAARVARRTGLVIRRPPRPRGGGPRRSRHAVAGGHVRSIASAPPAGSRPDSKRR